MFETDMQFLRKEEERYKINGLKIDDKDILLKDRYKYLKMIYIISIVVSISYAFVIGFAFGRG